MARLESSRGSRVLAALLAILGLASAAGALYQQSATARDARRFPPPGLLVDIGGRHLHLLCEGAGSPLVVLEHSGLGSVLQYQGVMAELAKTHRVCAYDRAGFGWSEASPLTATAENLEADLDALLRQAGLTGPFIFVASSAGGLTVEMHVRKHPRDVAGIVWVDAVTSDMVDSIPELSHLATEACEGYIASWFGLPRLLDVLNIKGSGDAGAERSAALTYRTRTLAAACSSTRAYHTSAEQIRQAPAFVGTLPAIVLEHGVPTGLDPGASREAVERFEPRWAAAQRRLASQFKGGKLEVIADSGHLIALERPAAVVHAVGELPTP